MPRLDCPSVSAQTLNPKPRGGFGAGEIGALPGSGAVCDAGSGEESEEKNAGS